MTKGAVVTDQPGALDWISAHLDSVRARDSITLGNAHAYVSTLSTDEIKVGGCYKVYSPCCCGKNCVVGYSCPCHCCGCCLWTPFCMPFLPLQWAISPFFCVCKDSAQPGAYSMTDMKGNTTSIVLVDGEKGTLAYFGENEYATSHKDDLKAGCYCEK